MIRNNLNTFRYYKPTTVLYGNGQFAMLGSETKKYGQTALLVRDNGPLEKMGIFAAAKKNMEDAGLRVVELDGITANPRLTRIDDGIVLARQEKADVVIAVGGGSTIDTAKAIALGVPYEGDVWDFFSGKAKAVKALPVGVVTTIAGTGSETDDTSVVSCDRPGYPKGKWDSFSALSYPKFAIMDPELHVSVPKRLTAAGMADAISHASEAYFFDRTYTPFIDQYVEGLVKSIIDCEPVLDDPSNLDLRGMLCWTTSLAIDGLGNCGRHFNEMGWPAHLIHAGIAAVTDARHGDGLAILLPACCAQLNKTDPSKNKRFGQAVFGIKQTDGITDTMVGEEMVRRMRDLYQKWGLPITLKEIGVRRDQFAEIIENILSHPGRNPAVTKEYVEEILESCYE